MMPPRDQSPSDTLSPAPSRYDKQQQAAAATPISAPPLPPFLVTPDSGTKAYHPDFLFCGSCTTCQPAEATDNDPEEKKRGLDSLDDYLNIGKKPQGGDDAAAAMHETRLQITGFPANSSCFVQAHFLLIQSLLHPMAGVESVSIVAAENQVLSIRHTLQASQSQLVAALKRGGYNGSEVPLPLESTLQGSEEEDLEQAQRHETRPSRAVRSQFHVGGICCAMEIPAIRKIVKPLLGVETLQINITTKMVYVQHDESIIQAQNIAFHLTKEGFPSEVVLDGGAQLRRVARDKATARMVARTTLQIQKGLLDEHIIHSIRQQLNTVTGIRAVHIDEKDGMIFVEHDISLLDPKSIPSHVTGLSLELLQTQLEDSNVLSLAVARSEFVESTLLVSHLQHQDMTALQNIFRQNYIRAQVRAFFAHVPSHSIKVEHNPKLLPIHDIPILLEHHGFIAHVAVDGKEAGLFLPVSEDYGPSSCNVIKEGGMMDEDVDTSVNLKWHVILSGLFWVLSMVSVDKTLGYFKYFGLLSVLFGLPPVARKACRTLSRRQFDSNCMMVSAALGALLMNEFDEAASVAFLFSVSEFLEARSTSKARKALQAIVQLRPDHASVIHPITKEVSIVPASQVPVGSLLSVRTGDKIAADGVVVEGISTVDESSLTGESKPIMKRVDDVVSGGTINVGSTQLVVKTTSSVEDSVVSRLIKVVEDAQSCRSMTEKMIDKFAKSYTPFVICMAAFMCTVPWIFGPEIGRYWTMQGLIIIVISCPCSLTISTPVTYAAGLAATAQRGIIVKGGAHLEALGGVGTVVFDKTGTLTHGQFHVDNLTEIGHARSRKEMLELLALMEAPSSHPLSETLVRAARQEGVSIPRDAEVSMHTILKGEGVTAKINGKQVYVGNQRLFQRIGMYHDLPVEHQHAATEWSETGATVGFIGVEEDGIIGAFSMVDTIRDEAYDTIQSLLADNIDVIMLTGDGDGAAKAVARQLGIPPSAVHSQLLPEDKFHFVGSLIRPEPSHCGLFRSKSKVLFIGDGINDTPALAVADVGVSMGDGAAALAMEISDVTLMDSSLSKLLYVIKMGNRVVLTIQENIAISLLSKLLVVALTFAGRMTLFGAIVSDVGVMLMVTLNGMKLLPVTSDVELKPKRRLRRPKFAANSDYDMVKTDTDADTVELFNVQEDSSEVDQMSELVP